MKTESTEGANGAAGSIPYLVSPSWRTTTWNQSPQPASTKAAPSDSPTHLATRTSSSDDASGGKPWLAMGRFVTAAAGVEVACNPAVVRGMVAAGEARGLGLGG